MTAQVRKEVVRIFMFAGGRGGGERLKLGWWGFGRVDMNEVRVPKGV